MLSTAQEFLPERALRLSAKITKVELENPNTIATEQRVLGRKLRSDNEHAVSRICQVRQYNGWTLLQLSQNGPLYVFLEGTESEAKPTEFPIIRGRNKVFLLNQIIDSEDFDFNDPHSCGELTNFLSGVHDARPRFENERHQQDFPRPRNRNAVITVSIAAVAAIALALAASKASDCAADFESPHLSPTPRSLPSEH